MGRTAPRVLFWGRDPELEESVRRILETARPDASLEFVSEEAQLWSRIVERPVDMLLIEGLSEPTRDPGIPRLHLVDPSHAAASVRVDACELEDLPQRLAQGDLLPEQRSVRLELPEVPAALLRLDGTGRILAANAAAARLLGKRDPAGVEGRSFLALLTSDRDRQEILRQLGREGELKCRDCAMVPRGGSAQRLDFDGRVETDGNRLVATLQIDDQARDRRSSEAREQLEAALELFASRVHGMAWITDRDLVVRKIAGGLSTRFGGEDGDALGKGIDELYSESLEGFPPVDVHRRALRGEAAHCELEFGEAPWQVSVRPLWDDAGEVVGCVGVAVDLSDRRSAIERLRRSEERLRLFTEMSDQVFAIMTPDFERTLYVSPSYTQVFDQAPDLFYRSPLGFLDRVHPEDRARVRERLRRTPLGSGEGEFRIVRTDESIRYVWGRLVEGVAADGQVDRIYVLAWDVTERRRLRVQLQHAQKMEALGRLAAGVAHDFSNVLSVISGYVTLLLDTLDRDQPTWWHAAQIRKAAEQGGLLTQQLKAFGKQRSAQSRGSEVDLNGIIDDIEPMLGRLIREDVELCLQPGERLGLVDVDPGRIYQVIMNLVVNATEAMPQGGRILVSTANVTDPVGDRRRGGGQVLPGSYVELAVKDSGVGMDEDTAARLFEPFFTTKGKSMGTGLGLSTVYSIVTEARGQIVVDSEPGKGACFRVLLPRLNVQDDRELLFSGDDGEDSGDRVGRGETVLFVEDEAAVREIGAQVLRDAGYSVYEASDGLEALDVLDGLQDPLQVLVTDVVMPGLSGRELVQQVVKRSPETKIIYVSGYPKGGAPYHPGAPFLEKPFLPATLLDQVHRVIESR